MIRIIWNHLINQIYRCLSLLKNNLISSDHSHVFIMIVPTLALKSHLAHRVQAAWWRILTWFFAFSKMYTYKMALDERCTHVKDLWTNVVWIGSLIVLGLITLLSKILSRYHICKKKLARISYFKKNLARMAKSMQDFWFLSMSSSSSASPSSLKVTMIKATKMLTKKKGKTTKKTM